MRLEKIIARSRIIDLRSGDLPGALQELLAVSVASFSDLKPEALLKGLLARESTMTTYLGLGVALPHVRVKMSRRYILAIGRSRAGIRHDGALADERVHLIVMLIAGEKARDYLQVLASIARQVKEQTMVDGLVQAPDLDQLYERLVGGFGGIRPVQTQQNRVNRLMLREAQRVAKGSACDALMVFGHTFTCSTCNCNQGISFFRVNLVASPLFVGQFLYRAIFGHQNISMETLSVTKFHKKKIKLR